MLLSLEIYGFKSFPEATRLDFDSGITAIVGPNGSGKSNVTDAIRWGLSEQSAKILRGQRMSDMIFNGTAQRHPMSYAEVILTLDNAERLLPIDSDIVSIGRRYHRSGESEYYINQASCRLKDINNLLVDTGIGLDGYSIVGQGKIDEILDESSDDRRLIFDEASGIVQFKDRKAESERRLAKANQNLLRVDDITQELQRQAKPLQKQSEDASRYQNLEKRYKELDLSIRWSEIKDFVSEKEKISTELANISAEIKSNKTALEENRKDRQNIENKLSQLEDKIEHSEGRYNNLAIKKADTSGNIALAREKENSSRLQLKQLNEEQERLESQIKIMSNNLANRQEKQQKLESELIKYRSKLEIAEKALEEATTGLSASELARGKLYEKREKLKDDLFIISGQAQNAKTENNLLKEQVAAAKADIAAEQSELNRTAFALEEIEANLKKINAEFKTLSKEAETIHSEKEAADQEVANIEQNIRRTENSERDRSYEIETLTRLEQNYEGYQRPVRNLMQTLKQDQYLAEGVIGPLGSLLFIPEDLATAIEVALGAMVHNIVCQDENCAKKLINYLRQYNMGRVTFLPQSALRYKKLSENTINRLKTQANVIGLASDLVEIQAGLEDVLDYALGRVVITETLDDAIILSQKNRQNFRIVSRSGDIIYPGGSMTGGSINKKHSGLAGRPARIKLLKKEQKKLQNTISALQEQKKLALDTLHELAAKEEKKLIDLNKSREAHSTADFNSKTKRVDLDKLQKSLTKRKNNLEKSEKQREQSESAYQSAEKKANMLRQEISQLEHDISQLEIENKEAEKKRKLMHDDVSHLEISVQSFTDSLNEMKINIEREDLEDQINKKRITEIDRLKDAAKEKIKVENKAAEDGQKTLRQIELELQQIEKEIKDKSAAEISLQQKERNLENNLENLIERKGLLQSEQVRLKSQAERIEERRNDALNNIWEDYNITLHEIEAESITLGSLSKARRERNRLKADLKKMGAINHNAAEDYKQVQERIEYCQRQRQDIENARSELTDVIASLEEAMRERFQETFDKINENFSQIFAELFNGGMAQLTLSEGDDLLDADIIIRAQPPGKKLSRLSLLSGGERCLTAIALIFAILRLKPTPFVVFDEIESALDDVNGQRFANYIKNYSKKTQFILVTHRKTTMEVADRLYGFTMQEKGISSVLSMKLDE